MSEGAAAKRLQQELMAVMMSQDKDCSAFPSDENLFEWTATITGSPETVYEGLVYKLRIAFGPDYPFKAPKASYWSKARF
jgi:ubiquitin-protein ligase